MVRRILSCIDSWDLLTGEELVVFEALQSAHRSVSYGDVLDSVVFTHNVQHWDSDSWSVFLIASELQACTQEPMAGM